MELIYEGVGKKVYRDGDRLIKSFDETYSKADILNEALNQARVEQTSLNIPKILGGLRRRRQMVGHLGIHRGRNARKDDAGSSRKRG